MFGSRGTGRVLISDKSGLKCFQQVVREADYCPLTLHLLQTS
jgi:hypothetical protein